VLASGERLRIGAGGGRHDLADGAGSVARMIDLTASGRVYLCRPCASWLGKEEGAGTAL